MPLNADYLFAGDNVIAELKCLENNPMEASDWPPRLAKAFRSTGYSLGDLIRCAARGEPVPDKVKVKLFSWLREAIRSVVKTGNRQIRGSARAPKSAKDDRPMVWPGLGASDPMRREQAVLAHHPSHTTRARANASKAQPRL
jgi:hypothetical protein